MKNRIQLIDAMKNSKQISFFNVKNLGLLINDVKIISVNNEDVINNEFKYINNEGEIKTSHVNNIIIK